MSGSPHGMYVIVGDEPVKTRQVLSRLRKISSDWRDVDASAGTPTDLPEISLFSAFGGPQVTVIRNWTKWTAAQRKAVVARAGAQPDVTVVMCAKLAAKDPARTLGSERIIDASPPTAAQLPAWARRYGMDAGLTVTSSAAKQLALLGDTAAIASEIDKVASLAWDREEGVVDVDLLDIPDVPDATAWPWVDAVCAANVRAATAALLACDRAGTDPFLLTGALAQRVQTAVFASAGMSAQDAQVKPFVMSAAHQLLDRRGKDAIRTMLEAVIACQLGLRGDDLLPAYMQLLDLTSRCCRA